MGTSYPIRLITIEGRKSTPDRRFVPTQAEVESAKTFDEVKEILEKPITKGIITAKEEPSETESLRLPGRVGLERVEAEGRGPGRGPELPDRGTLLGIPEERPSGRRGSQDRVGAGEVGPVVRGAREVGQYVGRREGKRYPGRLPERPVPGKSRLDAADISKVSSSDLDALINKILSERKGPQVSEEAASYGAGFDLERYQLLKSDNI